MPRDGDRTYRSEFGDELVNRPENVMYSQLNWADQRLRAINKEMDLIVRAPTLADVQKLADDRAKASGDKAFVGNAKMQRAWNDTGALKTYLMDSLTAERNEMAKRVMQDVRKRKVELTTQ